MLHSYNVMAYHKVKYLINLNGTKMKNEQMSEEMN